MQCLPIDLDSSPATRPHGYPDDWSAHPKLAGLDFPAAGAPAKPAYAARRKAAPEGAGNPARRIQGRLKSVGCAPHRCNHPFARKHAAVGHSAPELLLPGLDLPSRLPGGLALPRGRAGRSMQPGILAITAPRLAGWLLEAGILFSSFLPAGYVPRIALLRQPECVSGSFFQCR